VTNDAVAARDPLADSRYAYARAAAAEGDWRAAADVLEQALERAPGWPPALFALGEAREKLGDSAGAATAFRASLAAEPDDSQGAAGRLALLGATPALASLPPAYIAHLFDDYAPRFDKHLTEALVYRGPELIAAMLDEVAPGRRFAAALDLGCGTGLAGAALRARVDRLAGVDLSPAMVAKGRALGIYDEIEVGEIVARLGRFEAAFDLIVAADALVYFGGLDAVVGAAGRALAPNGLFAFTAETFTTETFAGEGFRLDATMRFSHARAYIETTAAAAGLRPLAMREASARREAGKDTPGVVGVFARA
jgi:predicted TPR repeat methyltransferase